MSLLSEFEDIVKKKDLVLLAVATELRSALVKATPVDTGNLKASWSPLIKTDNGYRLSNTAIYADIRLEGYRIINGKQYGSLKFPEGFRPILAKYGEILQQKLKEIK